MDQGKSLVLVIEDDKLLRDAIVKKLSLDGLSVKVAASGSEALEWLDQTELLPGVVWLDYYLPDVNGMDFVKAVKDNPKLVEMPIVVVSNSASASVVEKMIQLGVQEYLLKVDRKLEDIVKIVTSYIKK